MSAIKLATPSSGSISLSPANTASNLTITVPAVTGTMATTTTPSFTTTIGVGGATPAASGAGITFPATQSASSDANTLDDYEEGTWTPIDGSGAGLNFSPNAYGYYVKIGGLVTCSFSLIYPSTANSTSALIGGFPFTVGVINSVDNGGPSGGVGYTNASFVPQLHVATNTTGMNLYNLVSAVTNANMSTKALRGTFSYRVA